LRIENHLGLVLGLAILLGLFCPGVDKLPEVTALYLIAAVFFVSCFKISKKEFLEISIKRSLLFYLLRFVALPLILLFFCREFLPEFATGVFLLTLMPAGISSPPVSGVLNGNLTLALSLVLLSSLAAPFVVPLMFYLTHPPVENMDLNQLFVTLSTVIFVPLLLHLPFRHVKVVNECLVKNNKSTSVFLFGLLMVAVVAVQRNEILADWQKMGWDFVILFVLYGLYYVWAWYLPKAKSAPERITFAICSGLNNNALGISLALACFPEVALFLVLTSLPWAVGMIVFKVQVSKSPGHH
jgi:BASS family bile acid:Na+ symporter